MASLNQCNFIGNVGQIDTRYLPSGEAVTNLSLAVNDKYKNKAGEMVEHTEWVRVSFFAKLAEIASKYVHKGDPLYVSGQMRTRKYTDKEGQERYSTEIRGDRMQMLGSKGSDDSGQQRQQEPRQQQQPAQQSGGGSSGFEDFSDDIPFATCAVERDVIWKKLGGHNE